jgi:hypothetical protein
MAGWKADSLADQMVVWWAMQVDWWELQMVGPKVAQKVCR